VKPRSPWRCLILRSLSGGLYGTAAASFALLCAEYARAAQCQNHCRERRAGGAAAALEWRDQVKDFCGRR